MITNEEEGTGDRGRQVGSKGQSEPEMDNMYQPVPYAQKAHLVPENQSMICTGSSYLDNRSASEYDGSSSCKSYA